MHTNSNNVEDIGSSRVLQSMVSGVLSVEAYETEADGFPAEALPLPVDLQCNAPCVSYLITSLQGSSVPHSVVAGFTSFVSLLADTVIESRHGVILPNMERVPSLNELKSVTPLACMTSVWQYIYEADASPGSFSSVECSFFGLGGEPPPATSVYAHTMVMGSHSIWPSQCHAARVDEVVDSGLCSAAYVLLTALWYCCNQRSSFSSHILRSAYDHNLHCPQETTGADAVADTLDVIFVSVVLAGLPPMESMLGGIVGQKRYDSGSTIIHPLSQFFCGYSIKFWLCQDFMCIATVQEGYMFYLQCDSHCVASHSRLPADAIVLGHNNSATLILLCQWRVAVLTVLLLGCSLRWFSYCDCCASVYDSVFSSARFSYIQIIAHALNCWQSDPYVVPSCPYQSFTASPCTAGTSSIVGQHHTPTLANKLHYLQHSVYAAFCTSARYMDYKTRRGLCDGRNSSPCTSDSIVLIVLNTITSVMVSLIVLLVCGWSCFWGSATSHTLSSRPQGTRYTTVNRFVCYTILGLRCSYLA